MQSFTPKQVKQITHFVRGNDCFSITVFVLLIDGSIIISFVW